MALHTVSIASGLCRLEAGIDIAAPGAFEPVLYCEREISVSAIIAKEIEAGRLSAAPVWSDCKTLCRGSIARYLDAVGVDAILGGYPCQPFSVAGKRRGKDDPRHLWPWIADAIERFRPSVCFFENVSGHLVSGFEDVACDLERLGFRVAAGLFTAAEVGASHRRERLFIFGVADDQGERWGEGERRTSGECGHAAEQGSAVYYPSGARRNEAGKRAEAVQGSGECVSGEGRDTVEESESLKHNGAARGQERPSDRRLPLYPPGPGDTDGWRAILERWPELAPAVGDTEELHSNARTVQRECEVSKPRDASSEDGISHQKTEPAFRGLADGLSRADQLRAYGNSIVADCAAVAFLSLWGALSK